MAVRALSAADEAITPLSGGPFDPDQEVGQQLRQLRKAKGLTLHDVASRAGFSVSYLSQIERNVCMAVVSSCREMLG